MDTHREIKGVFTDAIFEVCSRIGKDGHRFMSISRPCYYRKPIIIRKLFASRDDRPLYWIDCMPGAPSMGESEVERKVIEDITEGLLWENIR